MKLKLMKSLKLLLKLLRRILEALASYLLMLVVMIGFCLLLNPLQVRLELNRMSPQVMESLQAFGSITLCLAVIYLFISIRWHRLLNLPCRITRKLWRRLITVFPALKRH